jgi:hypothetical protein
MLLKLDVMNEFDLLEWLFLLALLKVIGFGPNFISTLRDNQATAFSAI